MTTTESEISHDQQGGARRPERSEVVRFLEGPQRRTSELLRARADILRVYARLPRAPFRRSLRDGIRLGAL